MTHCTRTTATIIIITTTATPETGICRIMPYLEAIIDAAATTIVAAIPADTNAAAQPGATVYIPRRRGRRRRGRQRIAHAELGVLPYI